VGRAFAWLKIRGSSQGYLQIQRNLGGLKEYDENRKTGELGGSREHQEGMQRGYDSQREEEHPKRVGKRGYLYPAPVKNDGMRYRILGKREDGTLAEYKKETGQWYKTEIGYPRHCSLMEKEAQEKQRGCICTLSWGAVK